MNVIEKKDEIILITGAQKTGTSTLVGILNCHPHIFILYETNLTSGRPKKYAKILLEKYPNQRNLFRFHSKPLLLYSQLREFLNKKGYPFKIIGDKIPTLDGNILDSFRDHKVIFLVRDIRTWLCKSTVIRVNLTKNDIVPIVLDYCSFFLKSFLLPNVLHLRMEDLIYDIDKVITKIDSFLKMKMTPYINEWWKKIDKFKPDNPKYFIDWHRGHFSSRIKPEKEDVKVILKSHPFWDEILPIFDKYYKQIYNPFNIDEINQDIKTLDSLSSFSPIPLSEAYKDFKYIQLVPSLENKSDIFKALIIKLMKKFEDFYRKLKVKLL